jgi:hypothetical protein
MISSANAELSALEERDQPPEGMRLPLVRLKVEHSGFNTVRARDAWGVRLGLRGRWDQWIATLLATLIQKINGPLRSLAPPRPQLPVQRFGSSFVGRVANPSDLLLFWRRPVARVKKDAAAGALEATAAGSAVIPRALPAGVQLEDLITRWVVVAPGLLTMGSPPLGEAVGWE